ncbi:hypothetical protein V2J09_019531 [Rumex salicifolius]
MACLGVQIGSSAGRRVSVSGGISEDIQCRFRHSLLDFTDERQKRCRRVAVCLAQLGKSESYGASVVSSLPLALSEVKSTNGRKKPANPPQVDNLIKRSVTEIVKNINEAPFLVHLYSESNDSEAEEQSINNSQLKLEIERATTESWPFIRQRWEGENSASPDGVILVEELSSEEALLDTEKEEIASSNTAVCSRNQRIPPSSTKVWGLVVQGRGANCPSCYILKTCRVQCCSGFSTHFCLAKVDCFGKSIEFHLNRMWLK